MALSSTNELQHSPMSYLMLPFLKANIMSLSAFLCLTINRTLYIESGLVTDTHNPSIWEAEAGGLPGGRLTLGDSDY